MRAKTFELLDFPKFASPSVDRIVESDTAALLVERQFAKSFMSYGQIWPRLVDVVRAGASESYLKRNFSSYTDEWKNKAIQSAVRALSGMIGGKGVWYRLGTDSRMISGFVFKSSIRGVWFYEGQSYAVLINARKSQRLSDSDILFLARGIYELYCREDPNDPLPMIIDLSAREGDNDRSPVSYVLTAAEAMPLASFEETLRLFLNAMHVAGLAVSTPSDRHITDLLRRPPN